MESDIQKIAASSRRLSNEKKFAKSIDINQQPTISSKPEKTNKLLNGAVAGIVGCSIPVFRASLLNISQGKSKK